MVNFDSSHLWLQFLLTALSLLHRHALLFLKDTLKSCFIENACYETRFGQD